MASGDLEGVALTFITEGQVILATHGTKFTSRRRLDVLAGNAASPRLARRLIFLAIESGKTRPDATATGGNNGKGVVRQKTAV